MPYFPKHHTLFIHIPKNGGKSIEVALGLAPQNKLHKYGQRSVVNRFFTFMQRLTTNPHARQNLHGTLDVALCAQHLTLQEILLLKLDHCTKSETKPRSFAVFRDPFKRAISTFRHYTPGSSQNTDNFQQFCAAWYKQKFTRHDLIAHQRSQLSYIVDLSGRVAVDRILVFESLNQDFKNLCEDWALGDITLPHIGLQSSLKSPVVEFSVKSRDIIESFFSEDIEFYNKLMNLRKH